METQNISFIGSELRAAVTFFQEQAERAKVSENQKHLNLFPGMKNTSYLSQVAYADAAITAQQAYVNFFNDFLKQYNLGNIDNEATVLAPETIESKTTTKVVAPVAPIVEKTEKKLEVNPLVNAVKDTELVTTTTKSTEVDEVKAVVKQAKAKSTSNPLMLALEGNSVKKQEFAEAWENGETRATTIPVLYDSVMGEGAWEANKRAQKEVSEVVAEMENIKKQLILDAQKAKVDEMIATGKINIKSGITPETAFSGVELANRGDKYEIDGKFNILVLAGADDEESVKAEDLLKLKAKQLLATGQEGLAVDFFMQSHPELNKDEARIALFKMIRDDNFSELRTAVKQLLMYGSIEKGDYHTMLGHVNNLVRVHSKSPEGKTWKDNKIINFVDKCVTELVESGYLQVTETLTTQTEKTPEAPIVDAETSITTETTPEPVNKNHLSHKERKAQEKSKKKAEAAAAAASKNVKAPAQQSEESTGATQLEQSPVTEKSEETSTTAKVLSEKNAEGAKIIELPVSTKVKEEAEAKEAVHTAPLPENGVQASNTGPNDPDFLAAAAELKAAYEKEGILSFNTQRTLVNNPVTKYYFGDELNTCWGRNVIFNPAAFSAKELFRNFRKVRTLLEAAEINIDDFMADNGDKIPTKVVGLSETVSRIFNEKRDAEAKARIAAKSKKTEKPIALPENAGEVVEQKPQIIAWLEKVKGKFVAYLDSNKTIRVEGATTEEEAQTKLHAAMETYVEGAEKAVKAGKKINIPNWFTQGAELVFQMRMKKAS